MRTEYIFNNAVTGCVTGLGATYNCWFLGNRAGVNRGVGKLALSKAVDDNRLPRITMMKRMSLVRD